MPKRLGLFVPPVLQMLFRSDQAICSEHLPVPGRSRDSSRGSNNSLGSLAAPFEILLFESKFLRGVAPGAFFGFVLLHRSHKHIYQVCDKWAVVIPRLPYSSSVFWRIEPVLDTCHAGIRDPFCHTRSSLEKRRGVSGSSNTVKRHQINYY